MTSVDTTQSNALLRKRTVLLWSALTAVLAVVISLSVFSPALFDFFTSDDFFTLIWLKAYAHNPALILQDFCGPWLSVKHPLYYRPLVSLDLLLGYMLWGANGLDFRLESLVYQLANSAALGLTVYELSQSIKTGNNWSQVNALMWTLMSALLFAAYPLQSYTVNWMSCRSELLASLFILLTVWSYMRWRRTGQPKLRIIGVVFLILAFLAKETAIIAPMVVTLYELLFGGELQSPPGSHLWPRVKKTLVSVCPWWLTFIAYLLVRKLALGTAVGGWDASISFFSDDAAMWHSFRTSIARIVFPVNSSGFGTHSPITTAWLLFAILLCGLFVTAVIRTGNWRLCLFLVSWFVLGLVPSYRFLCIDQNLLESVRGYIASQAICVAFAYAVATFGRGYKLSGAVCTAGAGFFIVALPILYTNNQQYALAGREVNRILEQLRTFYSTMSGDPPIDIVGLPLVMNGAYVTMNANTGMMRQPFQARNISNCKFLDSDDQSVCLGIIKDQMQRDPSAAPIRFLYWNSDSKLLKPVVETGNANNTQAWTGGSLKQIMRPLPAGSTEISWDNPDRPLVRGGKHPSVELDLEGLPCWTTDFVRIDLQLSKMPAKATDMQAELQYRNDIANEASWNTCRLWRNEPHATIAQTLQPQQLIFPLRELPPWSMGDRCHRLILTLPSGCEAHLTGVATIESKLMIPRCTANWTSKNGLSHVIELAGKHHANISYDASSIAGCADVVLEVLRPGHTFATLNSPVADPNDLVEIKGHGSVGELIVDSSAVHAKGVCEARLRALDKVGRQVGCAGDHFFILL